MTEQSGKIYTPAYRGGMDWRYDHSMKGYVRRKRYNNTEKAKACRARLHTKHGGATAYERERLRRIQDEAGCHSDVRNFYPAYCLIRALATAEVVEI